MATERSSLLGIQVGGGEVRIVEARRTESGISVSAVGSIATPAGAYATGRIENPHAIAGAIQSLSARIGAKTRDAVFSVAPEATTTRVLEVPNAADDELRMIVDGEVRHFQILREGSGAFNYCRVHHPGSETTTANVLVVAAEDPIMSGIVETAKIAKLSLVGSEPAHLGLLRNAVFHAAPQEPSVVALITPLRGDIAVMHGGELALYRTVDYTGRDIVAEGGGINEAAASGFATEIVRSIEYFKREFPQADSLRKVIVATDLPEIEPLAPWLTSHTEIETVLASAKPKNVQGSQPELDLPGGLAYSCALGHAASIEPLPRNRVPLVDLSYREHIPPEVTAARRGLAASLGTSIVLIAAGITGAWFLGNQGNTVASGLSHMKEELQRLQSVDRPNAELRLEAMNELRTLARQGVPLPRMMDAVMVALDSGVGLQSVEVNEGWKVKLTGEAVSETSLINTLERLRQYPNFRDTGVVSFTRISPEVGQPGAGPVRFEIETQFLGVTAETTGSSQP